MVRSRSWYALAPLAEVPADQPWTFALAGRQGLLLRTPAGELVGRLDGRPLPVQVHWDMVFAWFDPTGAAPDFDLPAEGREGWPAMRFTRWDLPTTPEVIMRDLVDARHFETVHGYGNVAYEQGPTFEESAIRVKVGFDWDTGLPGPARGVRAGFTSEAHGLGYQRTEVTSLFRRYNTLHLVLPTPLDAVTTRVHLGVSARVHGRLGRGLAGRLTRPLAWGLITTAQHRDIGRDARMWSSVFPGHHAPVEEELRAYRTWTKRFETAVEVA